jgi:hypothetical protein
MSSFMERANMKKQILFTIFIFQIFIFLIPSLSIAKHGASGDSQAGCSSNSQWQQNVPWWGWTPAHDHLKVDGSTDCSNPTATGSSATRSSAQTMSSGDANSNSSNGCGGSGQVNNNDSSYRAWWGWTNAHDHLGSGMANCGQGNGMLPENLFILFNEAKAFKADGPDGQLIKNYEIDISQIKEKPFKMHGVHLAEIYNETSYKGRPDNQLTFSKGGKKISSDLEGGKKYVVIKSQSIGRVANTYDMLCAVDRVRGKLKPESLNPICTQILCSPDFIESSILFEKFSELSALKSEMQKGMKQGRSITNLQLGGLGLESRPGGSICDKCTRFTKGEVVIPSQDCGFPN